MKMARKTVNVKDLVEKANFALSINGLSQLEKAGVACFLETFLFETGNYKGYRYLNMYKDGDTWKWPNEYDREYFCSKHLKTIKKG
jgi:hypothetical protein